MTCRILLALTALLIYVSPTLSAEEVGIKTNIVSDAFLNVNLGAEVRLDNRWSIDLTGEYNGWSLSGGKRWKHWMVQPEIRYSLKGCEGGSFLAAHLLGGQYNYGYFNHGPKIFNIDFSGLKNHRDEGWYGGIGVAYGYGWILDRHWNIEAVLGLGWVYMHYKRYECADCNRRTDSGNHNYIGPTKVAVNLIYSF